MKRETFNLMRPFALKAVGLVVALVILPPAIILGILRKGWSGFFSVPFRKLPPALMYDSQWGTHRYGTGIQVSFTVSLPMLVTVSYSIFLNKGCRIEQASRFLHCSF